MNGPLDRLAMDLDVTSEAGLVRGPVTADFRMPVRFVGRNVHVERLNIAPYFKSPNPKTDVTGDATFDVTIFSDPTDAAAVDRLGGTFAFKGPRVSAFGYEGANIDAAGAIEGREDSAGARARDGLRSGRDCERVDRAGPGQHSGARSLEGSADRVDLRRLPASVRAPRLDSTISASAYKVQGSGTASRGSATLKTSSVEGATIADGTVVEFETGNGPFSYAARGSLTGLDVRRLGNALNLPALDKPFYDGRVSGALSVTIKFRPGGSDAESE